MDGFADYGDRFVANGVDRGFLRGDLDSAITAQIIVGALLDLLRRSAKTPPTAAYRKAWTEQALGLLLHGAATTPA